ncbi:syntaxin-18 isoform X2 [Procambarus clarkii]|nr:syntaxin-18-like isoform X2 [Procambarus clarkii]XP_045603234.1 syntaxin-18-like isoform X2 [Procambarus clarkii]XP_045603235.1 syntaxin-18-like isoform X2 [Procambarus clarkii]
MTVETAASLDLTTLFKSCVKTIRTRNKAMGVALPQTKIFPPAPTHSSQFYSRARDVMSNIASHRNLLKDHKKKYLQDQDQTMSDYERSFMEKVVTTNLRIIDDNIHSLNIELQGEKLGSKDARECQENILAILRLKFQETNSTFKHMKEQRRKKEKEKDNLFRVQRPVGSKKQPSSGSDDSHRTPQLAQLGRKELSQDTCKGSHPESWSHSTDSQSTDHFNGESLEHNGKKEVQTTENKTVGNGTTDLEKTRSSTSLFEEEMERMSGDLSAEERQMLEEENAHLYKEVMSNHEEVRQITRQVVELSQMQDLFSENVDLQAHQIEENQETIMASTENVRSGNEQVREAMRKDAGFRVWIMFFLIVMSCTILFLDWYNG